MSLSRSLNFIINHPLCRPRPFSAVARFVTWQIRSRTSRRPYVFRWVDGVRLIVERGVVAGTGNLYVGLHEYPEMGFFLHFLRPGDLFVDIGANIGSYTLLASGVCGARTVSFEPVPTTFERLRQNIAINDLDQQIDARREAVGAREGLVSFTTKFDSVNHVVSKSDAPGGTIDVPLVTLTKVLDGLAPIAMKMDVEGFETAVFDGGEGVFQNHSLRALVVELNGCGRRYGFSDEALHDRIVKLGFQAVEYDPKIRKLTPRRALQGDANVLYVRDPDFVEKRLASAPFRTIHGLNASI